MGVGGGWWVGEVWLISDQAGWKKDGKGCTPGLIEMTLTEKPTREAPVCARSGLLPEGSRDLIATT